MPQYMVVLVSEDSIPVVCTRDVSVVYRIHHDLDRIV